MFDLVKNVPIADRMLLLSDIAQFDENARIRERALQALVGFGATDYPEALVPAVQQGLRDDSDDVRRAAVSAAAEIDGEIAAEIALERLREDSAWGVRVAAAEVLGQNGGVDAIPELVHGLQRNGINEYVLANAVKAISKRLGTDPVVTKVKGVSDKSVREALLKAVAEQ